MEQGDRLIGVEKNEDISEKETPLKRKEIISFCVLDSRPPSIFFTGFPLERIESQFPSSLSELALIRKTDRGEIQRAWKVDCDCALLFGV
ncbi:hypothetical protein V2J09_017797 [Rumex salicifolius]